jgi:toxin secretion/phage lysis holin
MDKIKALFITVFGTVFSALGILAVPVFLLVGCNLIDYFTGIAAAKYREEPVSSYKGIRGIIKKVCMWLLIVVGWMLDVLIQYAATTVGLALNLPFLVATVAAVWLICNEIISILENMIDMDVDIPPFLLPLVSMIKRQAEEKIETKEETDNE